MCDFFLLQSVNKRAVKHFPKAVAHPGLHTMKQEKLW